MVPSQDPSWKAAEWAALLPCHSFLVSIPGLGLCSGTGSMVSAHSLATGRQLSLARLSIECLSDNCLHTLFSSVHKAILS